MTVDTNFSGVTTTVTMPIPSNLTNGEMDSVFVYSTDCLGANGQIREGYVTATEDGQKGFTFETDKVETFMLFYVPSAKETKYSAYVQGYQDGSFKPNAPVTRTHIALMMSRFLTNWEIPEAVATFDDTKNSPSKDAIEYVKKEGLFNGVTATEFDPDGSITRAQMAGVVTRWIDRECAKDATKRYCEATEQERTFTDVSATHWAAEAIARVSSLNIMIGNSETTFNPQEDLTRAQAVKILNRLFERPALEAITKSKFNDVAASHWAIGEIEAAATKQVIQE